MAVSKEIPFAVRRIEFSEADFRENSIINFDESLISREEWIKFSNNALVFTDGNDIMQYAYEYPIVKYECDQNLFIQPDFRLNSFIKSITLSNATNGKIFSIGTGKIEKENTGFDSVAYYEDNFGICHSIIQNDIRMFLLKKPNLVVSPEGVLVFYTNKHILGTLDCGSYIWIRCKLYDNEYDKINSIDVQEKFLTVVYENSKEEQKTYKINFKFDFTDNSPIIPIVKEL